MPWFVAKRAIADERSGGQTYEYRVVSEAEIETIDPDWDWASAACATREEAQTLADDQFWDSLE